MKKTIFTALALMSVMAMTACGGSQPAESVDTASTGSINASESDVSVTTVYDEVATTVPTETPTEPVIATDDKLVPDCPVNVSADIPLQEFYVFKNSEEVFENIKDESDWGAVYDEHREYFYSCFDVTDCYVKDVLDSNISLRRRSVGIENDYDFKFVGEDFDGIYMEAVSNGSLATGRKNSVDDDGYERWVYITDKDVLLELPVKGVADSRDNLSKTPSIVGAEGYTAVNFYGDIHINTEREEVEALLGTGQLGTHPEYKTVMYNNGTATMVIHYKTEEAAVVINGRDTIDYVEFIYLISNN